MISELNPNEDKTDPRKIKDGTEAAVIMTSLNGQIVYGGVDHDFNSLRIFPPLELNYPVITDDDFFE